MSSRSNRLQLSCGRGTYDKDGRAVTRYFFCLLSNSYTHAEPIDTPSPLADDSRTCNPIRPNFRDESIFEGRRIQTCQHTFVFFLFFFFFEPRDGNGTDENVVSRQQGEGSKLEKERGGKEAVTTCIRASTPTSKHDLPSVPRSRRLTPRITQPRNSRPVPDFDGYHLAAAPVDATRNDQSREIGRITGKKGRNEARPPYVLSLQGDRIKKIENLRRD